MVKNLHVDCETELMKKREIKELREIGTGEREGERGRVCERERERKKEREREREREREIEREKFRETEMRIRN